MANYKVSYKMLKKQGEEICAVAKLVDGYSERVNQIKGKLGQDQMLLQVRNNLQKLQGQLGESRTVLNTAGTLLIKTVECYTATEVRQVKQVDSLKAHNRDFYKNPVVVASAGGAAQMATASAGVGSAGVASASVSVESTTTTVNVTEVTNVVINEASTPSSASVSTAIPTESSQVTPMGVPPVADLGDSQGNAVGAAVIAGVAGVAMGAGGVLGAQKIKDQQKKRAAAGKGEQSQSAAAPFEDPNDPEVQLAKAMQRVRDLEEKDSET